MKVFSLRKYKKWCKRTGSPGYNWADELDGLTEEELVKRHYLTDSCWMESRTKWENRNKKTK